MYFFFIYQITELISTIIVLHLANSDHHITSRKILTITGIAIVHVAVGEFITNVIRGEGYAHQVVFMASSLRK